MLNKTATVEQMLKWALIQLEHAHEWENEYPNLPEEIIQEQASTFRAYAQGLIMFIYQSIGYNGNHIGYDGISIPESMKEYLNKLKEETI